MYKTLLPWTRQTQQAGDSFSGGDPAWPAASTGNSKIPGDFPSTTFPVLIHTIAYAWLDLLPIGSPWAACMETQSRQWVLQTEASLKAPTAGHSIKLKEATADNFHEKLKKNLHGNLKTQKGEDKRMPNVLALPQKRALNMRVLVTLGLVAGFKHLRFVIFRSRLH